MTFEMIVLGCCGGPRENNISGYLLAPRSSGEWVALDAGSLLGGIDKALEQNNLEAASLTSALYTPAGVMLLEKIRAYLISHAHLDHIAGLVINSQIDQNKPILGIDPTINNLRDHIFNGLIWPNYGNEGVDPILNRYHYIRLPLHQKKEIPHTSLSVEAYLLCHPHGYPSTAFLIEYNENYLLYFGDTSSDTLENEKHLTRIWNRIAPLIQQNRLKGILLECSFSKAESAQVIYGHLDTKLMTQELKRLEQIADSPLKGLKVMVTHRKESLKKQEDPKKEIEEELLEMNDLGIHYLFPTQGARFLF